MPLSTLQYYNPTQLYYTREKVYYFLREIIEFEFNVAILNWIENYGFTN